VDVHALLARATVSEPLREEMLPLARYGRLNGPGNVYDVRIEDLWLLYAISRVSDLMLLSFQGRADEPAPFPALSEGEYLQLFEALGFEQMAERPYSPFFHEIVEVVETDDPRSAIEIDRQFWPGLMFGDLLFARAGVRVRAHTGRIRKEYAESTLLCFNYMRHRRRAADLSMGWGSNSQWRTAFRRDYLDGEQYRFNVDGEVDVSGEAPRVLTGMDDFNTDVSIGARREILVNRCFVSRPYPWLSEEDWPSRDTLTVSRDDPLVSP
jgi:hypothetical protein